MQALYINIIHRLNVPDRPMHVPVPNDHGHKCTLPGQLPMAIPMPVLNVFPQVEGAL